MRFVKNELASNFNVDYQRNNGLNITSLVFSNDILSKPLFEVLELTINDSMGMGRDVASKQAEYDFKFIPSYKKRIVINVLNHMFFGVSFAAAYFKKICCLLNKNQTVVVYLPANTMYVEQIKEELKEYPIEFVLRK